MFKTLIITYFTGICMLFAQDNTKEFKIMSYNIKHGHGMDNVLDLSRAANVINSQKPDYCALQEIDSVCTRSNKVNQVDYLANKTNSVGTFGKFMNFQEGAYGMATLTTKPVVFTKTLQLPKGVDEPRSCIIQEIKIDQNCTILLANVHFDWLTSSAGIESRLKQANALLNFLNNTQKPVIITGDFNCTPNSPTMKLFKKHHFKFINKGNDNLSFQGNNKLEIDHVIYRNSTNINISPKNIKLLNEPIVSDHRPLVTELKIVY